MTRELYDLTALELSHAYRTKELSPVEVTRAVLARAEASQPTLNAFITICADQALDAAKAAVAAIMQGRTLGPLHGVPFTVKDLVNTKDVRTTFGSFVFEHNIPKVDHLALLFWQRGNQFIDSLHTFTKFSCFMRR